MAVAFALVAAIGFGAATALQHAAAREVAAGWWLFRLLGDSRWLLGTAFDLGAYGCQALALRSGQLLVVQVVVVLGVVVALGLSARMEARRISRPDLVGCAAAVVGVALLVLASGSRGHATPDRAGWIVVAGVAVAAGAVAAAATGARFAAHRATAWATAAAMLFATTALLTKAVIRRLDLHGLPGLLAPPTAALLAAGAAAMVLTQYAFRSDRLAPAAIALTVVEPAVSVLLGLLLLGERFRSPIAAIGAVVGILLALSGAALVTHAIPEPGTSDG